MVSGRAVNAALSAVGETELRRLCRIADRFLIGNPWSAGGDRGRTATAGAGTEFADYREYAPGDDLRAVDWRASARSDRLHVRRYRDDTHARWLICLDRSASMAAGTGEKWLCAVQVAAALAYLMVHRGATVGLLAFSAGVDRRCWPARGRPQYAKMASMLRDMVPRLRGGASLPAACRPYIARGSSVVLVSDFLAPDAMIPEIDALMPCGARMHALQLLSPREGEPDDDCAWLEDIESGERLPVRPTAAESPPSARLRDLCRELRRACRRRGIAFDLAATSTPWAKIVSQFLFRLRPPHG